MPYLSTFRNYYEQTVQSSFAAQRVDEERKGTKSSSGYISLIWGNSPADEIRWRGLGLLQTE